MKCFLDLKLFWGKNNLKDLYQIFQSLFQQYSQICKGRWLEKSFIIHVNWDTIKYFFSFSVGCLNHQIYSSFKHTLQTIPIRFTVICYGANICHLTLI